MATQTLAPSPADAADAAPPAKKSKKKLFIIVGVVLAAAAAWFFLLRPSGGATEKKPGELVTMEPIQINLADGHYLRLGLTLQMTTEATETDGSKALDSAIDVFSGVDKDDLLSGKTRTHLKKVLLADLEKRYDGTVLEVYFADFVTQ